jgi:hypothetical protein
MEFSSRPGLPPSGRLLLQGRASVGGSDLSGLDISLRLVSSGGDLLDEVPVALDGSWKADPSVASRTARVLVGPACLLGVSPEAEDAAARVRRVYRASTLARATTRGGLRIPASTWRGWIPRPRSLTGQVLRARPGAWWFDALEKLARPDAPDAAGRGGGKEVPFADLDALLAWPGPTTPASGGEVEVWRIPVRRRRWTRDDPDLPLLRARLHETLEESSHPGMGGPLVGGTLHLVRLHARRDLAALDRLDEDGIPGYLNARPWLRWLPLEGHPPELVAVAPVGEDGILRASWLEYDGPPATGSGPNEERGWRHACIVRQSLGPVSVVIHDGVRSGRWFGEDEDPVLLTHHPLARSLHVRPSGNHVFLEAVGSLPSSDLQGPAQRSADSLRRLGPDDGLVSPMGAGGADGNRNLAGVLALRLGFGDGLEDAGARYFRVSVAPAGPDGKPRGTPLPVNLPMHWLRVERRGGIERVEEVRLGPDTVGGTEALYRIPHPHEGPWDAGQAHILLDTTDPRWSDPEVRHLVMLEILDGSGCRLRPQGTPPTGLPGAEREAGFHFARHEGEASPPVPTPFGALTHVFWWDNRPVRAQLEGLRHGGRVVPADHVAQALSGAGEEDAVGASFRAWHPNRRFLRHHALRFLSGTGEPRGPEQGTPSSSRQSEAPRRSLAIPPRKGNAGAPPGPPAQSPYQALARLLDHGQEEAGFEVRLVAVGRSTDGSDLSFPRDVDRLVVPLRRRAGRGAA